MYVRRLPSGRWQATVRLRDGSRRTHTAPLKGEATAWAVEQEARIRRDGQYDPSATRILYDTWRKRWWDARVVEEATARGDKGMMVNHVDPQFTGVQLSSIGRMDVQSWVKTMQQKGVGAHAIRRSYNLLTTMLGAAVLEGVLSVSPCRKIDLPATPPKAPAWFTVDEVKAIIAELPHRHGVATALMVWTGLRWGEMAGLRIMDVDWTRRRVSVVGARTQAGHWKEYPKSSKSRREVPVPIPVLELMRDLAGERPVGEPLFQTIRGSRPWSGQNWRVVWTAAVERAKVSPLPPHTCRHTAASWLVQAGVPLYHVQALLGHESFATTQRYAHLAPNAHDSVLEAWRKIEPLAIEAAQVIEAEPA